MGEDTTEMAVQAALRAIKDAGVTPEEIELIIVATVTPTFYFPSAACLVQARIGAGQASSFDISAGCTGFIYGFKHCRSIYPERHVQNGFSHWGRASLPKLPTGRTAKPVCFLLTAQARPSCKEVRRGLFPALPARIGTGADYLYCQGCSVRKPILFPSGITGPAIR